MSAYAASLPDAPPSAPPSGGQQFWPHSWIFARMPSRKDSVADWAAYYHWSAKMYRLLGRKEDAERDDRMAKIYET